MDIPIVVEAIKRGIPLSNDAQEFLIRCPAPVIGITGSAGKTTTTTLVAEMLKKSGYKTWMGGNIGNPLINTLPDIQKEDKVVMELSSFQLELMQTSPHYAGVLNITPNHLDRHKTMDAYIKAKRNIIAHQNHNDFAILGQDDEHANALQSETAAQVFTFSGTKEVEQGSYIDEDTLVLRRDNISQAICEIKDIRLRGYHNVLNTLAAVSLAGVADANIDSMKSAIKEFGGVEHRLEEVAIKDGVLWVNDSIATAPERVCAALASFQEPIILLAGGRDKDLPWEEFSKQVIDRVRVLITFGEAAVLINRYVQQAVDSVNGVGTSIFLENIVTVDDLVSAVRKAYKSAHPGEVVLLSPGGTSFDAYDDFVARGMHFKQLVRELS
jgi:UDP-N-acetylmuramoylalanine--D-glutamate ligase